MRRHRSWHDFHQGETYSRDNVISECRRRINEKGLERKTKTVDEMERKLAPNVIWQPFSSGFGASPFNKNCWPPAD